MEFKSHKCSSIEHKEVDAIKYCQECKAYFCKNCEKFHSNFFQNHHIFPLDKNLKEIFTGFCKVENHQSELNYFCKDHNELICAKCITKMKTQGNGQHTDCNICDIGDIYEEKKKNLADKIKNLENLSKLFQASIEELKKIFDEIDKNKEEIQKEIQTVFTKIRTALNKREDELLKEVDKIYEKKIFNQNVDVFKDKKFNEKIKTFIEKGKLVEKEWEKNSNKNSLINDCINIEKTINKINKLNNNIEGYKIKNKILKFYSEPHDLLGLIKKQGSFNNNINQQEINIDIDDFNPQNLTCVKQICNNFGNPTDYVCDGVCFFISRNDEYVLGYIDNEYKSIIFYDINNNKELKKFNSAHDGYTIYTIKYYDYSKYDMILSSSQYSLVKIWNFNESTKILNISSIFYDNYSSYYIVYSSCIIFNKNNFNIFCVTADNSDYIRMYNSDNNGNLDKNIGNNIQRYYIDSCELDEKKYLIVGGYQGVEVYNYPDLNQYHYFKEDNNSQYHYYAKIVETNHGYNLIEVGSFNTINIWDFIDKKLISKIKPDTNNNLKGFVVINNEYLFIGSQDKSIKEFDIENKTLVKSFNKHTSSVVGLKPAKDKNGNIYIISYGQDKNIFLWGFK